MWTSHRQKLGEMRGKASNVDWAAREAAKEFKRLGEASSNAAHFLTLIGAPDDLTIRCLQQRPLQDSSVLQTDNFTINRCFRCGQCPCRTGD